MPKRWPTRTLAVLALAVLGVGTSSAGTAAIGYLGFGYDSGYQTVSFYNMTGATDGCNGAVYTPGIYGVCNAITVQNWTLTLTYTNENPSDTNPSNFPQAPASPLTFVSGSDTIGAFNGTPYTGGSSGTWQIPLSVNFGAPGTYSDEPACGSSGPCDYELTQVEFKGTLDQTTLYLGTDANTLSNDTSFNPVLPFDTIWNPPSTDYTSPSEADFIADQQDVTVTDQALSQSLTPEPASLLLIGGGILAIGFCKRRRAASSD